MNNQITDHQVRVKADVHRDLQRLAAARGTNPGGLIAELLDEIAVEKVVPEQVRVLRLHVLTDKSTWRRVEQVADELGYRSISALLDVRLRELAAESS